MGSYFYGEDDRLVRTETDDSTVYYYYDSLGRVYYTRRVDNVTGKVFYTNYYFLAGANGNSTSFVSKVTFSTSASATSSRSVVGSIEYTYDTNGFISSVTSKNAGGAVTGYEAYTYDALGQLLTVSDGTNVTSYTYDKSGNILTEKYNGTTVGTYTYGDSGWKDLLTAYNGETITYDGIGNPTKYIGWDTLTWSMGRRLTSLSNGTDSISYTYNADGQRISKTVNGVTTTYYYDDRGSLVLSSCSDGTKLYFYTNADGSISSFEYNGNHYYYVRNAQNDIVGIVDSTGAFVARYTYDAWGKITSITDGAGNDVSANATHIANINPLRYRSYFYDAETGWYWLNTRYYNPVVGRFINADGQINLQEGVTGYNLFQYCGNNPINRIDPFGCSFADVAPWFVPLIPFIDGPLPIGDIVCAVAVGVLAICGVSAIPDTNVIPNVSVKEEEKTLTVPKVEAKEKEEIKNKRQPIKIYRYGGKSNLKPSKKDVLYNSGLSFSTIPGYGAAVTTIEALELSGLFYVVWDSPTHVLVYPIGGTIEQWRIEGSNSIWTKALKKLCLQLGGN